MILFSGFAVALRTEDDFSQLFSKFRLGAGMLRKKR